jgi:hypothetical protein
MCRGQAAKGAGVVDHDVQAAEALEQGWPYDIDLATLPQVERKDRRLAAGHAAWRATKGADGVVGFLQAALGPGGNDDMGTEAGEFDRRGRTDASAGAGDQGDRSGKRAVSGHRFRATARGRRHAGA